jgi:hypothetical protein
LQTDLFLIYLINFFIVILGARVAKKSLKDSAFASYFYPFLVLKIIIGIFLGLLYTFYYENGDSLSFFNDSLAFSNAFRDNPLALIKIFMKNEVRVVSFQTSHGLFNGIIFIKVIAIINIITGDCFWLTGIYFSMFVAFCTIKFINSLIALSDDYRLPALTAFILFPETIFWSSGISKESLSMGSLLLLGSFFLSNQWTLPKLILSLILTYILFFTKFYVLSAIIIIFLPFFIYQKYFFESTKAFIFYFIYLFILLIISHLIVTCFYNESIWSVLIINHDLFKNLPLETEKLFFLNFDKAWQIAINIFLALLHSFSAPISSMEFTLLNSLYFICYSPLLILLIFSMWFMNKQKIKIPILIRFILSFGIIMSVIIPISAPVTHAFIRYRSFYSPFLVFAFFYIIQMIAKKILR